MTRKLRTIIVVLIIVFISSMTGFAQYSSKVNDFVSHKASYNDTVKIDNLLNQLDTLLNKDPGISNSVQRFEYDEEVDSYFDAIGFYLRLLGKKALEGNAFEQYAVTKRIKKHVELSLKRNNNSSLFINAIDSELTTIKKSLH